MAVVPGDRRVGFAATAVSSRPTPRPTATASTTSRVIASRPPLTTSRSPSPITAGSGERGDRAVPDDDLAVGVGGDPGVVGDQDHGGAVLAGGGGEQVHHQLPRHRVQRPGWLVGEQHLGTGDQAAGQRDPLRLPARQFPGPALLKPIQAEHGNHFLAAVIAGPRRVPGQQQAASARPFSSAVSSGTSWPAWNTNPNLSRRSALRRLSLRVSSRCPLNHTSPASGTRMPARQCSRVDLPEPLGPMTATISPFRTPSDAPRSACVPPNERDSSVPR